MIEIQDFIKERGGDPEKIRESQRRRNASVEIVDEVIELFEDHRRTQYEAMQFGTKLNEIQKQIGQKKKAKQDADDLIKEKEELGNKKKAQEEVAAQKYKILLQKAKSVGNYVHESVPVSNTEDENALIREWKPEGTTVEKKDVMSHHEVLWRLGGYDSERAVKIVGHRGYCLTGMGLFLNRKLPYCKCLSGSC
jgi:seryl-tRNA synthetase